MLEQGAKKLPLHALKASAFMHKAACKTAKRKWSLIAQSVYDTTSLAVPKFL